MTREEAIKLLDPETTAEAIAEIEYYHGFRGREAAIAAITDACSIAVKALREKPVVHAHWIEKWTEESGHELICSNCGEYALMNGEFYSDASKYCPYCGATMDEPILSMKDVCRIEKEMEEAGVKTLKIENPFLKEENNEN